MGPVAALGVERALEGGRPPGTEHLVTSLRQGSRHFLQPDQPSSTQEHPRQHYSFRKSTPCQARELSTSLKLWVPQRGNSTLTNLPQETDKERAYAIAALGISYEKSKVMLNTASKTLHLDSLCQRGTVSNREQAWKPHNLSLLSRGITKKLKYKTQTPHLLFFFFNTLAYDMRVNLSIWISWWLVWTAKPWVLTAQEGAGVTGPCPMPAVPFTQGSGLYLDSGSHGCTRTGHSHQPQRGWLSGRARSAAPSGSVSPCSWMGNKALQKHPRPYPGKSTSDSSIGTFVIWKGGKQPSA